MPSQSTIAGPHGGLGIWDCLAVVAYLLVTAGIVYWSSRKQSDTEDFFLGGRSMPWLAVGLSIMATLLSTITYLGVPGEMIKNGVAWFAGYLSLPFAAAVVILLWIPFFMRLRMTSAYEYLEHRFDYRARLLAGILFLLLRMGWMSMVVYTASLAMVEMTIEPLDVLLTNWGLADVDRLQFVIVVVGVAATIYTCAGGLRAVIWTDVLQSAMLFGGVFLVLGYVMWTTGTGPSTWWAKAAAEVETQKHTNPIWFSFNVFERTTIFSAALHMFFWTICTHASDQVVLQRYFSTNSLTAARRSFMVNMLTNIAIGVLLALSGLALLYFYLLHKDFLPGGLSPVTHADKVLPYFYSHQLMAGFGGLILVSFLCDAMQTLVSGVNSIAAIATKDVFERWSAGRMRQDAELKLARVLTVVIGLLATLLAVIVAYTAANQGRNIVDLMAKTFNMFLGPLATLFFIGMFLPRATIRSAIPAVFGSVTVSFVWSWWRELCQAADRIIPGAAGYAEPVPSITLAISAPCCCGLLFAWILGWLLETGGEHPGRQYTWRAVMRRPAEPLG